MKTDYLIDAPDNPNAKISRCAQFELDPRFCACLRRHAPKNRNARNPTGSPSADFYKGDRAMRESGFDPSFRFGPFDGSTHHYAPVCLNSLLYKYEQRPRLDGHPAPQAADAAKWDAEADARKAASTNISGTPTTRHVFRLRLRTRQAVDLRIHHHLLSSLGRLQQTKNRRRREKNLKLIEQPGGIAMSDYDSGVQWDSALRLGARHLHRLDGMRRSATPPTPTRTSEIQQDHSGGLSPMMAPSAKNTTSSPACQGHTSPPATR